MSDQDPNIFNTDDQSIAPQDPPVVTPTVVKDDVPPVNTYSDLLTSITREDGTQKYSSIEDAIKALKSSQEHISTLEQEAISLKEEVSKRQSAEEILEKITSTSTTSQPALEEESVDVAEIVKQLVPQAINEMEARKTSEDNLKVVTSKLKDYYGDATKASEEFYSKGAELGFSNEKMNELAKESPTAIFKLLGVAEQTQTQNLSSEVNTSALNQQPANPRAGLKIPTGATGRDFASAWKSADQFVNEQ